MGRVVGRETELDAARALVAAAVEGRGGALALVGPPGTGKSLLLDSAAAAAVAEDVRVVRVVGVEAERAVPWAGLWALVQHLLNHEDVLTADQRDAIALVTGRSDGSTPGRLVLCGAVLALLTAAADRSALLVVVDDLQWVDRPSAEVLVLAARRLEADRVAVLLAARPAQGPRTDGDDPLLRSVTALHLAGLSVEDARLLLPDAAAEVVTVLVERTGGNPLALVEVAALLPAPVLAGVEPLPHALPSTTADESYRRRLEGLSSAGRDAARVLALAGRAPGDLVVEALGKLALPDATVEEVAAAGLARLGLDGVTWRHPLARSAAADGGVGEVRRVHAVLAECWAARSDAPQAVWHRAASVSGPDEPVAEALAAVAERSADRAAFLEAADAWERAAHLGEDPVARQQRLGLAARAAFRGGATARAARLYDRALATGPHDDAMSSTARLLHERGRVEHGLGRPSRSLDLLLAASAASTGSAAVHAAAEAVFAAMYARRPDRALDAAAVATSAHDPADPVQRFLALHAQGAAASLAGDPATAHDRLAAATSLLVEQDLLAVNPSLLLWAVNADLFLGGVPPGLHPTVAAALARLRESGELEWSPRVVRLAGIRSMARGSWDVALAAFAEATELSRLSGQRTQVAEGLLLSALGEAARGQAEECLAHTEEARGIVADLEVSWLEDDVWVARGLLHLTLDDPGAALAAYDRCAVRREDVAFGRVEALLRLGRRGEALGVLAEAPTDVSSPARCLVDDDPAAAHRLLEQATEAESAFEAARLRLAAGAMLRRGGSRTEAREVLREAEAAFTAMGTGPWTERARAEQRASGATLRRGPEGSQLTGGELRVATLVAEGRSNKEVAAALFLSPKTVEFHLGRAYRKLGVANRTALAARLLELGLT